MNDERTQEHVEKQTERREKKQKPKMRVSGKGMKRFAKPGRKKD